MTAHENWPDYSETDCPYTARTCKGMVITEGQYNYAKVRIDACGDLDELQLKVIAEKNILQKLAAERDALRDDAEKYHTDLLTCKNNYDALQQRCEELVVALKQASNIFGGIFGYTQDGTIAVTCANAQEDIKKAIAKQVQP